ncbi:hypothetical protein [Cohnella caldifontis]|uniref:hypothetical protein n=1 Tax=Cohnella caldifontis TaxID=3027471 RepID=UPI0023ED69A4|nr:hypothetical protein [Cohnella sp. YIM B05605]
MGTRLWTESMIRKAFPHLKYVRVHTAGRNSAAIYAWDENLELPDTDRVRLKRFAAGYLPFYLCCQVKPYSAVQEDGVPPVTDPPEPVAQAAMNRSLNQEAIVGLINGMLEGGRMKFERYDGWTGTIHFSVRPGGAVTEIEKELIRQYLYEVVPIGSYYDIAYP